MNENTLTVPRVTPSIESDFQGDSFALNLGNPLPQLHQRTASLMAMVTLAATLSLSVAIADPVGAQFSVSTVSPSNAMVYTGGRGAVPMTRRHAVTQVRGTTRTITRSPRYGASVLEDNSRFVRTERLITQSRGETRTIERKSRWSEE